jgi:hypothetical protein
MRNRDTDLTVAGLAVAGSVAPSWWQKWTIAALWSGGVVFVPVVAIAATVHLAASFGPAIEQSWLSFPQANHWLWASLGLVAVVLSGLVLVLRLFRGPLEGWLLPFGLCLVVTTRILAIALIHPPLISDWLKYYALAQDVASSGPRFADVPTGLPIAAGLLFKVFGANVLIGEFLNLAASLATGWLVYQLATQVWGRRAGGVALYLYAVSIAQLLMVTLFCTEVLFATGILSALYMIFQAAGKRGRAGTLAAFCCGVMIGLSQYIRADAELLLPAFLVMPFLAHLPTRRATKLSGACLAAFLLIMGPVALWNHATYGTWSVATSNYGGWSLLVGTDPQNNGQYNVADLALLPADTRHERSTMRRQRSHWSGSKPTRATCWSWRSARLCRCGATRITLLSGRSTRRVVPAWTESDRR